MKKLLVVDDDSEMLEELKEIFEARDINVSTFEDGKTSLAFAAKNDYDVAVIDVKLPDTSGIELIGELKKLHPDSYYIVMTAYPSLENIIKALRFKVIDYLTKPFDIEELISFVEKGFSKKEEDKRRKEK